MDFSRQEYWSGLPFPSPGDLPNPGIKPGSPALEADTLTSEPHIYARHATFKNNLLELLLLEIKHNLEITFKLNITLC